MQVVSSNLTSDHVGTDLTFRLGTNQVRARHADRSSPATGLRCGMSCGLGFTTFKYQFDRTPLPEYLLENLAGGQELEYVVEVLNIGDLLTAVVGACS